MDQDRQTPPAHLFKHRAVFFKGVPAMHFLPEADRPEVAHVETNLLFEVRRKMVLPSYAAEDIRPQRR